MIHITFKFIVHPSSEKSTLEEREYEIQNNYVILFELKFRSGMMSGISVARPN